MADEYDVNVEIPIDVLVGKLLNNRRFIDGLSNALRSAMLDAARASGDVFGGYAGNNAPEFRWVRANEGALNQAANGHWVNVGGRQTWVRY
jgi:hypothetical protein